MSINNYTCWSWAFYHVSQAVSRPTDCRLLCEYVHIGRCDLTKSYSHACTYIWCHVLRAPRLPVGERVGGGGEFRRCKTVASP